MSDDFEALKAMMADVPAPDAAQKQANIALAENNFKNFQGSTAQPRPTSESPPIKAGWISGAIKMLKTLTSRAGLAVTTSIAAVGIGVFTYGPWDQGVPFKTRDVVKEVEQEESLNDEILPNIAPAVMPSLMQDADLGRARSESPLQELYATSPQVTLSLAPPVPAQADMKTGAEYQTEDEEYSNAASNPLKITKNDPVSTFSIDVDTASYALLRSSISNGYLPNPDAIRIEEMINYFPYAYTAPLDEAPFSPVVTTMETPWNSETRLVHIGIQGALPEVENRPPLNLVFLIDTSGSMQNADKLPLLKQSFRLMLSQLRPEDQVAIVAYAGSAGQVLAPTQASERSTILAALERLEAGGGTAGEAGLQQAYSIAASMQSEGDVTRVLLATDGDFNVGIHDPDALKSFIESKRDAGAYLSVLGFGRGNLNDNIMQTLAQNGNGQAAYIDTLAEAQKVLVDQLTGTLFPIANDVKIQVEFNPAEVAEYRLIGYETRALNREDFNNDKVDAGEIGAGHQVTALYEITPTGSAAIKNDTLRYGETEAVTASNGELGFLKMRYKAPGESKSQLLDTPILSDMGAPNEDTGFAVAIAGFGQLLRDDTYLGDWGWAQAIALANQSKGDDPFGYRAEAITLMRLAQSLSEN